MLSGPLRRAAQAWIRAEQEGHRTHLAMLRLLAGLRPANLLDVGCSTGHKAEAYAAALGLPLSAVTGVETQEKYAALARAKFGVHAADLEREPLPLPDESFDLAVCNQVLEHLKNIFLPLAELDRVVRTGGRLIIGVPNLAGLYNRWLLLRGRQPLANAIDGPHVRAFAHADFLAFLRGNANFELEAVDSANLYPLPWPLLELLGGSLPGLSCFTFYRLRKIRHEPAACGWRPGKSDDTVF